MLLLVAALGLSACGSSHALKSYNMTGRTVAVVAAVPPPAYVIGDAPLRGLSLRRPIHSAVRVGSVLYKDRETRRAQARLDSAAQVVDVAERIAALTLTRSAAHLGYTPVQRPADADIIMDLRVEHYGLVADSWEGAVYFDLEGDLLLIDSATREVIWKKKVREEVAVSEVLIYLSPESNNVFTASQLSRLSVGEMERALAALADYTSRQIVDRLRDDYYDSRPVAAR